MASPHEYVFHPTKGGREGVYFVLGLNAILIALLLVLVVHRVVEPISTGPRTAIVFALEFGNPVAARNLSLSVTQI